MMLARSGINSRRTIELIASWIRKPCIRKLWTEASPVANIARIPITNVYANGDYTGRIFVGPEKLPMNVILDTGSSALALNGKKYHPNLSSGDQSTKLAQTEAYDDGSSWTGAVIKTGISIGEGGPSILLKNANAAVAYASKDMFDSCDGILGLAYAFLDDAFTMPEDTWAHQDLENQVRTGKHGQLKPYLTQLADDGVTSDKIAFLTRRSLIHVGGGGANDPLNQGWMIVGGGEECTNLYTGAFKTVKVLSDEWYNTNLKTVIVGNGDPIAARIQGPRGSSSNSIVDSGTASLEVSKQMFRALLSKFTPAQQELLTRSVLDGKPVAASALDLPNWPALTFVLQGDAEDVSLQVAPGNYWQVNTDRVGSASAAITEGSPGFTTLGLPLMNGYFTIFDGEAAGGRGVIKFATRAA